MADQLLSAVSSQHLIPTPLMNVDGQEPFSGGFFVHLYLQEAVSPQDTGIFCFAYGERVFFHETTRRGTTHEDSVRYTICKSPSVLRAPLRSLRPRILRAFHLPGERGGSREMVSLTPGAWRYIRKLSIDFYFRCWTFLCVVVVEFASTVYKVLHQHTSLPLSTPFLAYRRTEETSSSSGDSSVNIYYEIEKQIT